MYTQFPLVIHCSMQHGSLFTQLHHKMTDTRAPNGIPQLPLRKILVLPVVICSTLLYAIIKALHA